MKLITDKRLTNGFTNTEFKKFLKTPIEKSVLTLEEADDLEKQLRSAIEKYPAYGISATQLGIAKRACLIISSDEEKEFMFLVNPIITERSDKYFLFWESCLSLHNTIKKPVRTYRNDFVKVQTDNLGELTFKINPKEDKDEKVSLETLQTVVIQHEIDHLDGFTIRDRDAYTAQQLIIPKYGRNDKVVMKSPTGDLIEVKFKKANEFYLKGYEVV